MKAKCAALLVGMFLLGATNAGAATAPITYAVSLFQQTPDGLIGVGIGGSITTDGTLGPINGNNIVDWNLIGTAIAAGTTTDFFDLTSANSVLENLVNITATANALILGLPSGIIIPAGDLFFGTGPLGDTIEFTGLPPGNSATPATQFTVCSKLELNDACVAGLADGLTFADGKVAPETPTTTTPLPATLPLFATGIGALGLLGWRRKRKAQAVT
jgi:hypothetical protein